MGSPIFLDFFREGGGWMYAILAFAALAPLSALVGAILYGMRVRSPSVVWIGPLGMVVALGAVGVLSGLAVVDQAVAQAAPEWKQTMMAQGLSISLYTDAFARLCALSIGPVVALFVALAHFISVRGDRGVWTPAAGAGAGILAFLGFCVSGFLAGIRLAEGYASPIVLSGVVVAVLALPCLVGVGVRCEAAPEDQGRTAGARFVVWFACVAAAWGAFGLPEVSGIVVAFKAVATAAPEYKGEMLAAGMDHAARDGFAGVGAFAALLLAGLPLLLPLAGSLKHHVLTKVGLVLNVLFLLAISVALHLSGGAVQTTMGQLFDMAVEEQDGFDPGAESLDLGG